VTYCYGLSLLYGSLLWVTYCYSPGFFVEMMLPLTDGFGGSLVADSIAFCDSISFCYSYGVFVIMKCLCLFFSVTLLLSVIAFCYSCGMFVIMKCFCLCQILSVTLLLSVVEMMLPLTDGFGGSLWWLIRLCFCLWSLTYSLLSLLVIIYSLVNVISISFCDSITFCYCWF